MGFAVHLRGKDTENSEGTGHANLIFGEEYPEYFLVHFESLDGGQE